MTAPVAHLWITALGAALLHFIWEAGVIAALVALSQTRSRQASAQMAQTARTAKARYAWNCVALFSLPVVFATTLAWMYADGAAGWTTTVLAWWTQPELLPYVAGLWLLGVLAMAGHSLGGMIWLQRVRRETNRCVPEAWRRALERLRVRMGIAGEVGLGLSARALGPCVTGWWRPLILMPVSALAGMDPVQLEALLAHELAHIVRRDYVVNLAQRALEVVFFYHPAVWWLSAQVTQEREHCCDDMAINACGDALAYARALVDCAAAAAPRRELACAASGGELHPRVLRILGLPVRPARARFWAAATLALSLLGAGVWLHAPTPERTVTPAVVAPAVAHMMVPQRSLAALATALPRPAAPPLPAARPETPPAPVTANAAAIPAAIPGTAALNPAPAPAVQPRQPEFVAFSFAAVETCTPAWQWVGTVAPDGRTWISLEPVVSCVPVLQPTEVWVSNL
jgi:beta-lactamase regulating signal transducer with metallopeptidase domain